MRKCRGGSRDNGARILLKKALQGFSYVLAGSTILGIQAGIE